MTDDLGRFEVALQHSIGADGAAVRGPLAELVGAGGKRLRPALVLLTGALGDYSFDRLLPAALAVELTHCSTLVHDDVIDRSPLRRGRPTVFAAHGGPAAILVGDHYFAKAYGEAARAGSAEAVRLLATAVMEICEGEYEALARLRRYRTPVTEYVRHIDAKTAALTAVSCRLGALLGGLDEPAQLHLERYGRRLGQAFQIVDDVLDYLGAEAEVGKPVGHDLLEGSVTLPLILALQHPDAGRVLDSMLVDERELEPEVVADVVARVIACGACDAALVQARRLAAEAVAELEFLAGSEAAAALSDLAGYVVARNL